MFAALSLICLIVAGGTGRAGAIPAPTGPMTASHNPLDLGYVLVGSFAHQTVTYTNNTGVAAEPTGFAYAGSAGLKISLVSNTCTVTLNPGGSCSMTWRAEPTEPGPHSGNGTLLMKNGAQSRTIEIRASGTVPMVSISSGPVDLGAPVVGTQSAAKAVTISNTGIGPLKLNDVKISASDADKFVVVSENCTTNLVPESGSCTANVAATPKAVGPIKESSWSTASIRDPRTMPTSLRSVCPIRHPSAGSRCHSLKGGDMGHWFGPSTPTTTLLHGFACTSRQ